MPEKKEFQFYPGDTVKSSIGTTGEFVRLDNMAAVLKSDRGFSICFCGKDGSPPRLTLVRRGLQGRIRDMTKAEFQAALIALGDSIDNAEARNEQRRAATATPPRSSFRFFNRKRTAAPA